MSAASACRTTLPLERMAGATVQRPKRSVPRPGNNMKNLILAFLIVLAGAVLCFIVLSMFNVSKEIAAPIASMVFGAIKYVHELLDEKKSMVNGTVLFKWQKAQKWAR